MHTILEGLSGNSGTKPQVTKVSIYLFDMKISFKKPLKENIYFSFESKFKWFFFLLIILLGKPKDTILSFNGITPIFKMNYDKNERKLNILTY